MKEPKKNSGSKNYYDDELSREAVGKLFSESVGTDDIDFEKGEDFESETDSKSEHGGSFIRDAEPVDDADYINYMSQTAKLMTRNTSGRKRRVYGREDDLAREGFHAPKNSSPDVYERPKRPESAVYERLKRPEPALAAKPQQSRRYESYDDDVEEIEMSLKDVVNVYKYPLIGVSIVILLIFGFLIFRINSVNADYKEAVERAESNSLVAEANQGLLINIDNLRAKVDELTAERDDYKKKYDDLNEQQTAASNATTPTESEPPVSGNTSGGSGTQKTHTVVSGDSFWKLAIQYYSDGNRYKDIMAANNYKDENGLKVGVVIIIP